MKSRILVRGALGVAAALALAVSAPAEAQLFRAYLSTSGNDANPCTLPQPCRLLPAALAAVASGGEIWLLDSANYNTVTVQLTKSVTILAVPGSVGSVVASNGPAIRIATAGVDVTLRNLVMVPLPGAGGTNGIEVTAGSGVAVDGCLIANMPDSGIRATGDISVRVSGTSIRNSGVYGIYLSSGPRATVTGSALSGNAIGIYVLASAASSTTTAEIADTTIDANTTGVTVHAFDAAGVAMASVHQSRLVRNGYGAYAYSNAGGQASLAIADSLVTGNDHGIHATLPGASAWLSGSMVSHNGYGLYSNGALFESAGNNAVRRNTTNTQGTIIQVAPM
ncbi:MAG: right-handed parallel beta-helix repeat-containing protein [Burkholderiales bacterium]|nr:right-handed parallel beta-helix repeat-containing protein [Burkholderiales bacterium]MBZ0249859.1 right-handed parallel beta-helix repeat-containing protein [Burkholderiales bacterium]MCL4687127.1 right-handed parallel beta-helix repeat-containing protein [Burkholderiales bacterium]